MYSKATQELLLKFNKEFTWEVKVQLMGMKEHDSAKKIIGDHLYFIAYCDEFTVWVLYIVLISFRSPKNTNQENPSDMLMGMYKGMQFHQHEGVYL